MSLSPSALDRIDAWFTLKLGANQASFIRTYLVAQNQGGQDLDTWNAKLLEFTSNIVSPLLGNGDYTMSLVTNLLTTTGLTDSVGSDDIPLSINGQGNALPPNVSALSSYRPDPPKPRHVSRLYWPFISTSLVGSDTKLTTAGRATVHDQAQLFLGPLTLTVGPFELKFANVIVTKATNSTDILKTVVTSDTLSTQRRRLRGSQKASWETEQN